MNLEQLLSLETRNQKLETSPMSDTKTGPNLAKEKVSLKKPHPCGSNEFTVIQMGVEVVLKCSKCGSFVRLAKDKYERSIK